MRAHTRRIICLFYFFIAFVDHSQPLGLLEKNIAEANNDNANDNGNDDGKGDGNALENKGFNGANGDENENALDNTESANDEKADTNTIGNGIFSRDKTFVVEEEISGFNITKNEIEKFRIWPEGVIPYYIDVDSYDKVLRDKIRSHLFSFTAQTGLRFTEYYKPPDNKEVNRWVMFINRRRQRECVEYNIDDFKTVGMQSIRIGYDCFAHGGNIAAALLALVGVPPQHNAPDRDCYVNVITANIMPDKIKSFNKLSDRDWMFHDIPYDYCSASHFTLNRHSASGKESMVLVTKRNLPVCKVGESKGLSELDVMKVKLLYNRILRLQKHTKVKSICDKMFQKLSYNVQEQNERDSKELPANKKPDRYLGTGNTAKLTCDQLEAQYEQFTKQKQLGQSNKLSGCRNKKVIETEEDYYSDGFDDATYDNNQESDRNAYDEAYDDVYDDKYNDADGSDEDYYKMK